MEYIAVRQVVLNRTHHGETVMKSWMEAGKRARMARIDIISRTDLISTKYHMVQIEYVSMYVAICWELLVCTGIVWYTYLWILYLNKYYTKWMGEKTKEQAGRKLEGKKTEK